MLAPLSLVDADLQNSGDRAAATLISATAKPVIERPGSIPRPFSFVIGLFQTAQTLTERDDHARLVDVDPANGGDFFRRPPHDAGCIDVAQPRFDNQSRAECAADVVEVLSTTFPRVLVNVNDVCGIAHPVESPAGSIAGP